MQAAWRERAVNPTQRRQSAGCMRRRGESTQLRHLSRPRAICQGCNTRQAAALLGQWSAPLLEWSKKQ